VVDPRIERTRIHVLTVARSMLAERTGDPLTFSRLAEAAQVSRRTLYTHWGTIERVIGEAIALHTAEFAFDPSGLSPREILRGLLSSTRDRLTDPVTHLALTSLVAQASADDKAAEVLAAMSTERLDEYNELLGAINHAQYSQIVGPLFFRRYVSRQAIDNSFVDRLVDDVLTPRLGRAASKSARLLVFVIGGARWSSRTGGRLGGPSRSLRV